MSDVGARLGAVFGDGGAAVLAEAGAASFGELVRGAPPAVVGAPGPQAAMRLRDWAAARGDLRTATALTRGLLRRAMHAHGHEHPDSLTELGALGALAWRAGRVAEGKERLQKSFDALRSVAGGRDLRVAIVAGNLALALVRDQEWRAAEHVLATALRIRRQVAPATTGVVAAQLGEVRVRLGKLDLARDAMREAWERYAAQHGRQHARTLSRARVYGKLLLRLELYDQAVEVLRDVHAGARPGTEDQADAAFDLGVALDATGDREESLRLVEASVRWTRDAGDDELPHAALAARSTQYAQILMRRGRHGEVEGLLLEALEADRRRFGEASETVGHRYVTLGTFCANQGRVHEALGWLEPGTSLLRGARGDDDIHTKRAASQLITLLVREAEGAASRRDPDLVRAILARAWEVAAPVLGFGDARTRRIRELGERAGLRL